MKNVFKVALLATSVFIATQTQAQVGQKAGRAVDKAGHAVGHAAKKVGHKTSELAAKGDAAVVDKKYDGQGRHGETVYINDHSKYYYVNKRGHRVYVTKAYLRPKM